MRRWSCWLMRHWAYRFYQETRPLLRSWDRKSPRSLWSWKNWQSMASQTQHCLLCFHPAGAELHSGRSAVPSWWQNAGSTAHPGHGWDLSAKEPGPMPDQPEGWSGRWLLVFTRWFLCLSGHRSSNEGIERAAVMMEFLTWDPCAYKQETFSVSAMPMSLSAPKTSEKETQTHAGNREAWHVLSIAWPILAISHQFPHSSTTFFFSNFSMAKFFLNLFNLSLLRRSCWRCQRSWQQGHGL